jgi:hypothetical protein
MSISPSAVRADDRSGLFPENESSLFENHAPVRCRRVNPATNEKEFQIKWSTPRRDVARSKRAI